MSFKHKVGHLAVIFALSSAVYMPNANASALGVPSPSTGDGFNIFNIAAGATFTDNYAFSVNSDALFSFTVSTTDTVGTGALAFITNGASLSDVSLMDISANVSTIAQLQSSGVTKISPSNSADTYTQTTYSASLGGVLLNTGDSYELVFKGFSENSNSTVSGTIFLSSAPAVVAAVPLPSTTWLFLSGIMGFLGLRKNRITK